MTNPRADYRDLPGLSPDLSRRLHNTLINCYQFDTDKNLRAIFVDARIITWRNALPQATDYGSRVQLTIDHLYQKFNTRGENALVLLLQVLSECKELGATLCQELLTLADEADVYFADPSITSLPTDQDTVYYAVVAMKAPEAKVLAPEYLLDSSGIDAPKPLSDILEQVGISHKKFLKYYKTERDDWSPFGEDKSIRVWIKEAAERVGTSTQSLSEEFLSNDPATRWQAGKTLQKGGFLVVDTLSLFHPDLYENLDDVLKGIAPLALATISPWHIELDSLVRHFSNAATRKMGGWASTGYNDLKFRFALDIAKCTDFTRWLYWSLDEMGKLIHLKMPDLDRARDYNQNSSRIYKLIPGAPR